MVRAHGVHFGAMPFIVEGEGTRFQLDVLRPEPGGITGVFETASFSVFVTNHGAASTDPSAERGARALGAALQRRADANVPVPQLATFSERRHHHPAAAFEIERMPEA